MTCSWIAVSAVIKIAMQRASAPGSWITVSATIKGKGMSEEQNQCVSESTLASSERGLHKHC
jgi:hypothetical protein